MERREGQSKRGGNVLCRTAKQLGVPKSLNSKRSEVGMGRQAAVTETFDAVPRSTNRTFSLGVGKLFCNNLCTHSTLTL